MGMFALLRSYAAGLGIGAAVVGSYAGITHYRHVCQARSERAATAAQLAAEAKARGFEARNPEHAMDWPNTYGPLDPAFGEIPAQAPDVCVQYLAMITQLQHCDGFPLDSRDSMLAGGQSAVAAWRDLESPVPTATLQALTDGCTQSVDALSQTMHAACPAEIPSPQ